MTNINDQKIKVYFSFSGEEDQYDIISEILKENGVQEDIDDSLDKIEYGVPSVIDSIYEILKNIFLGKMSEEDSVLILQKNLNLSKQTAKNIIEGIKKNLLPFAKKIEKDETEKEEPITAKPTRLIREINTVSEKPAIKEPITPIRNKKIIMEEEKDNTSSLSKKPDVYREPIE